MKLLALPQKPFIQIEVVGNEPTVTLNLYGETEGSKRFEFDRAHQMQNGRGQAKILSDSTEGEYFWGKRRVFQLLLPDRAPEKG